MKNIILKTKKIIEKVLITSLFAILFLQINKFETFAYEKNNFIISFTDVATNKIIKEVNMLLEDGADIDLNVKNYAGEDIKENYTYEGIGYYDYKNYISVTEEGQVTGKMPPAETRVSVKYKDKNAKTYTINFEYIDQFGKKVETIDYSTDEASYVEKESIQIYPNKSIGRHYPQKVFNYNFAFTDIKYENGTGDIDVDKYGNVSGIMPATDVTIIFNYEKTTDLLIVKYYNEKDQMFLEHKYEKTIGKEIDYDVYKNVGYDIESYTINPKNNIQLTKNKYKLVGIMPGEKVFVEFRYKKAPRKYKFIYSYVDENGKEIEGFPSKTIELDQNEQIEIVADQITEEYNYKNWTIDGMDSEDIKITKINNNTFEIDGYMPPADVNLKFHYTSEYILSYRNVDYRGLNLDGHNITETFVKRGEKITIKPAEEIDGYKHVKTTVSPLGDFVEQKDGSFEGTMPSNNVSVNYQYAKTYKITLNYVDEDNIQIPNSSSDIYIYEIGKKVEIDEFKEFEKYTYKTVDINHNNLRLYNNIITGYMPSVDVKIDVIYETLKDTKVSFAFFDVKGNKIENISKDAINNKIGDKLNIDKAPSIDGYRYLETKLNRNDGVIVGKDGDITGVMPKGDLDITYVYEKGYNLNVEYKDINGDNIENFNKSVAFYENGQQIALKPAPEIKGYLFKETNINVSNGNVSNNLSKENNGSVKGKMPESEVFITYVYEKGYNVSFEYLNDLNRNIKDIEKVSYKANELINLIAKDIEGYSFNKISLSNECGLEIENNIVKGNIIDDVKITYTYDRNDVAIEFVSNGGTEVKEINGKYGDSIASYLPITKKDGYIFKGWFDNNNNYEEYEEGKIVALPVILEKDMTLYARYEVDKNQKYNFTINHILKDTNEKLFEEETIEAHVEQEIIAKSKIIEGYKLTSNYEVSPSEYYFYQNEKIGTFTNEEKIVKFNGKMPAKNANVNFVYEIDTDKKYELKAEFVKIVDGKEKSIKINGKTEQIIGEYNVNENISYSPETKDYYELHSANVKKGNEENKEYAIKKVDGNFDTNDYKFVGKMPNQNVILKYVYNLTLKPQKVVIKYVDEDAKDKNLQIIKEEKTLNTIYEEEFTIEVPEIYGYKFSKVDTADFVEKVENGVFKAEGKDKETTIKFVYNKKLNSEFKTVKFSNDNDKDLTVLFNAENKSEDLRIEEEGNVAKIDVLIPNNNFAGWTYGEVENKNLIPIVNIIGEDSEYYLFDKFYIDVNDNGKYDENDKLLNKDTYFNDNTLIKASFIKDKNKWVKVDFEKEGYGKFGSEKEFVNEYKIGTTWSDVSIPKLYANNGYVVDAWYDSKGNKVNENTELLNNEKYTVKFIKDKTLFEELRKVIAGTNIDEKGNPYINLYDTREGFYYILSDDKGKILSSKKGSEKVIFDINDGVELYTDYIVNETLDNPENYDSIFAIRKRSDNTIVKTPTIKDYEIIIKENDLTNENTASIIIEPASSGYEFNLSTNNGFKTEYIFAENNKLEFSDLQLGNIYSLNLRYNNKTIQTDVSILVENKKENETEKFVVYVSNGQVCGKESAMYKEGDIVSIEANGDNFTKWFSNDVEFENAENNITTFVMPQKNVNIVAKESLADSNLKIDYEVISNKDINIEYVDENEKEIIDKISNEAEKYLSQNGFDVAYKLYYSDEYLTSKEENLVKYYGSFDSSEIPFVFQVQLAKYLDGMRVNNIELKEDEEKLENIYGSALYEKIPELEMYEENKNSEEILEPEEIVINENEVEEEAENDEEYIENTYEEFEDVEEFEELPEEEKEQIYENIDELFDGEMLDDLISIQIEGFNQGSDISNIAEIYDNLMLFGKNDINIDEDLFTTYVKLPKEYQGNKNYRVCALYKNGNVEKVELLSSQEMAENGILKFKVGNNKKYAIMFDKVCEVKFSNDYEMSCNYGEKSINVLKGEYIDVLPSLQDFETEYAKYEKGVWTLNDKKFNENTKIENNIELKAYYQEIIKEKETEENIVEETTEEVIQTEEITEEETQETETNIVNTENPFEETTKEEVIETEENTIEETTEEVIQTEEINEEETQETETIIVNTENSFEETTKEEVIETEENTIEETTEEVIQTEEITEEETQETETNIVNTENPFEETTKEEVIETEEISINILDDLELKKIYEGIQDFITSGFFGTFKIDEKEDELERFSSKKFGDAIPEQIKDIEVKEKGVDNKKDSDKIIEALRRIK